MGRGRNFTVAQLKNKRDLLRKQFETEKAMMIKSGSGHSEWEYYDAMYVLMGKAPTTVGIPNARVNGQVCSQNQSAELVSSPVRPPIVADLNRTPPFVSPPSSIQPESVSQLRHTRVDRVVSRRAEQETSTDANNGLPTGIKGHSVQKSSKGKSTMDMAAAVENFTTAFVDAKKRKAEVEDRRTKILEAQTS
ncbi:hypothetical protein R1flu_019257 [Riccia fluitans]|uniref:Uncharacterized protein n=1 Tax=Riccia fluitans TaxID=41844 RepID=A0ABD1ZLL7_9MARC